MGKIVKSSDLTKLEGDPGDRSELAFELCEVGVTLPKVIGGGQVKITTRTQRGGLIMICSIATLLLVVSGCLVAAVAVAAGAAGWLAAIAGLVTPPAYFTLAHALFRRNKLGMGPEPDRDTSCIIASSMHCMIAAVHR